MGLEKPYEAPVSFDERVRANREKFLERMGRYRSEGLDRQAAMRFILEAGMPLDGPALDVGTGKGLTAIELARRGLEVRSVDVDPEEQRIADLNVRYEGLEGLVTFYEGDAASLPWEDGSFGCAAMVEVVHHIRDAAPVLGEVLRLLRPGGRLILADFTREGFDLVARMHSEEGKEHLVGPVALDVAVAHLKDRDMRLVYRAEGFLHDVAVCEKRS